MRKGSMKGESVSWLALMAVLLIALATVAAVVFAPLSITGGFTVRSITVDRTISNDADIQSANFIVDTVIDGSGGKIVGFIGEDEFKTPTASVQYPLEITAESLNERVEYLIRNQQVPVVKYRLTDSDWYPFNPPDNLVATFGGLAAHWYVVWEEEGLKGDFISKNINFDVNVSAKAHDEVATATLSNYEHQTVNLRTDTGNYIGTAKWTGSLITGIGLPTESGFVVVLPSVSSKWKVIDDQDWDDWDDTKDRVETILKVKNSFFTSRSTIEEQIDELNTKTDWLLSLSDTKILGSYQEQTTNEDNEQVISVNLDDAHTKWGGITRPNIVWNIRAYWLGAFIPVGEPVIESTETVEVYSGEFSLLNIKVRNAGVVAASFDASIVQPCNVKQHSDARITIPAEETRTIQMRVSQGAQNLFESGRCQVKVCDVNNPDKCDTDYFNYQLKKARDCDPGEYKGDAATKCIYLCSNAGIYEEVECCGSKEQLSFDVTKTQYDGWYCKVGDDGDENGDEKTCYEACIDHYNYGFTDYTGRIRCEIECWIKNHLGWFIVGGGIIVLLIGFKLFMRVNPYMRVLSQGHKAVRGR